MIIILVSLFFNQENASFIKIYPSTIYDKTFRWVLSGIATFLHDLMNWL
jgi:hypothetical protein